MVGLVLVLPGVAPDSLCRSRERGQYLCTACFGDVAEIAQEGAVVWSPVPGNWGRCSGEACLEC